MLALKLCRHALNSKIHAKNKQSRLGVSSWCGDQKNRPGLHEKSPRCAAPPPFTVWMGSLGCLGPHIHFHTSTVLLPNLQMTESILSQAVREDEQSTKPFVPGGSRTTLYHPMSCVQSLHFSNPDYTLIITL